MCLVETVVLAVIVSFLTARVTTKLFLGKIDKYTDDLLGMVKDFFMELITTLSKRP